LLSIQKSNSTVLASLQTVIKRFKLIIEIKNCWADGCPAAGASHDGGPPLRGPSTRLTPREGGQVRGIKTTARFRGRGPTVLLLENHRLHTDHMTKIAQ